MFITHYDNSFKLFEHWLVNAKSNLLNEEILNLQISIHGEFARTFHIVKTLIKTIMNEQQEEILENSNNCFATRLYSVYFSSTTNILDLKYEQNRNIILVTLHTPKFVEIHRPILCVSLKGYSLDINSRFRKNFLNEQLLNKLTNKLGQDSSKPELTEQEEYINYIKKLPLLELMINKEYHQIGNYTFENTINEPYILMFTKILMNTEYLSNTYYFKDLILDDIKMFVNEKVLLTRLSIIIYRLSFLDFDKNKSDISKFFSQKLALGNNENLYLNNLDFISRDLNTSSRYAAYDLRYLESKQIAKAEDIIQNQKNRYGDEPKFEFDRETIYKATYLSYEKIEELINTKEFPYGR